MNQSLIRWRKEDSIELQRAINTFNRNVKKLAKQENLSGYLPELKDYNKLRKEIISRKELNVTIASLRSLSKKGSSELTELPSGEKMLNWKYQELKKARTRALKSLSIEKSKLESQSRLTLMGNARLQAVKSTIENLNQLETKSGYDLKRVEERISLYGEQSLELRRAIQYRENYMNSLAKMTNYENYDKLVGKLEKIKNPIKFFEFVSRSETIKDLFNYYKDKPTAQTYGGFASNQDAFNRGLEELGIS